MNRPAEGGKAASLRILSERGLAVPPFFVVPSSAISETGLAADASASLERMLDLGEADRKWAVRSSATAEDGASGSHAGQYLSILDVEPRDVPDAVLRVWRSGETDSLAAYRGLMSVGDADPRPSVVVQHMVEARHSGVAFTAHPVDGRTDVVVVTATEGLGDRLVSGDTDGSTWLLDKATGRVLEAPDDAVLSEADLAEIHRETLRIEGIFGAPQDVEWAFGPEGLRILQARPITTLGVPSSGTRETVEDGLLAVLDNSNIVESYPGRTMPLTYSFASYSYARVYRMFVRIVGVDERTIAENGAVFDNMLARVDDRIWYNLGNWYRALSLLPGFALNRSFMERMMGVDEPLPAEVSDGIGVLPPGRGARLRERLRIAGMLARLVREAVLLRRTSAAYHARVDAALALPVEQIDAMAATGLAAYYRRIEADLLDRWDAPLVNDFLCMASFGAAAKTMERWCGPEGVAVLNDAMIGQGGIVSAEPAARIAAMAAKVHAGTPLAERLAAGDHAALLEDPAIAQDVRSYVAKFGDRCAEELKLESPTLHDDPSPLLAAVASMAARPPKVPEPASGTGGRKAFDALFVGRPVRRTVARLLCAYAGARVRDRENLRFERTRIFGRARLVFMAAGRRLAAIGALDAPSDVHFLTVQEVLGAIEGFGGSAPAELAATARLRKTGFASRAGGAEPPNRVLVRGVVAAAVVGGGRVRRNFGSDGTRKGTGCSAGIASGRARVVSDPRTQTLLPGEIMVARSTDPGWISLFANAAGIVAERGSLLSHSAIVSRELGIPCVVALKEATSWIRTGDEIRIDGSTGMVHVSRNANPETES